MNKSPQRKFECNIISAIIEGNEKAFEIFYRAEYCNLKYFLSRYLSDATLIEDVIQDSFLTIWVTRDKINLDQSLRSFLFTIARNNAINILRKNSFKLKDSLSKFENTLKINLLTDEYLISKIDALDMKYIIEKTYEVLPEKIKETFILSREFGMSYVEISRELGITIKVVEHNISAALKIFRKKLGRFINLLLFLWG